MTDKSELKLADGSRWDGDTVTEADGDEAGCNFSARDNAFLLWVNALVCVFATDALAAIRAVDGDPEYLELVALRERIKDAVDDICGMQPVESAMWLFDEFVRFHNEFSRDSMNRLTRLEAHLARLGYTSLEIERIATGNEIESDYICPQTLNLQVELDRLRAENEALTARCNDLLAKQAAVYNDGFDAGFQAAEKALGLNYTHVVDHDNPYDRR